MSNELINDLLYEFRGEEGSFLITARCGLEWSHEKFIKLLYTMRNYCAKKQDNDMLDKEIAEGFWFMSHFIKDWTSHKDFRRTNKLSDKYYETSYELIYDLSWWYFAREPIYNDEEYFYEEIKILELESEINAKNSEGK